MKTSKQSLVRNILKTDQDIINALLTHVALYWTLKDFRNHHYRNDEGEDSLMQFRAYLSTGIQTYAPYSLLLNQNQNKDASTLESDFVKLIDFSSRRISNLDNISNSFIVNRLNYMKVSLVELKRHIRLFVSSFNYFSFSSVVDTYDYAVNVYVKWLLKHKHEYNLKNTKKLKSVLNSLSDTTSKSIPQESWRTILHDLSFRILLIKTISELENQKKYQQNMSLLSLCRRVINNSLRIIDENALGHFKFLVTNNLIKYDDEAERIVNSFSERINFANWKYFDKIAAKNILQNVYAVKYIQPQITNLKEQSEKVTLSHDSETANKSSITTTKSKRTIPDRWIGCENIEGDRFVNAILKLYKENKVKLISFKDKYDLKEILYDHFEFVDNLHPEPDRESIPFKSKIKWFEDPRGFELLPYFVKSLKLKHIITNKINYVNRIVQIHFCDQDGVGYTMGKISNALNNIKNITGEKTGRAQAPKGYEHIDDFLTNLNLETDLY